MLRYFMTIYGSGPPPPRPELTGGPLDALVLSIDYGFGRLAELAAGHAGGWVRAWSQPWVIAALSNIGRTQQALELYETMRARGPTSASLDTSRPACAGRRGPARGSARRAERGRRAARAGGSIVYEELAGLSEARLALRLDRDPDAARAALDRLAARTATSRLGYLAEQIDAWYGYALLLQGANEAALRRLRRAVTSMRRSERMHELPTAAVYLAKPSGARATRTRPDRATDVALEAARRQGSNTCSAAGAVRFSGRRRPAGWMPSRAPTRRGTRSAGRCRARRRGRAPVRPSTQLLEFGRRASRGRR